jgi:hypothetical protein
MILPFAIFPSLGFLQGPAQRLSYPFGVSHFSYKDLPAKRNAKYYRIGLAIVDKTYY